MIVSGGQTGVDRGALDAALELGAACGGWCPQGRKAEDGAIPPLYPLRELEGAAYADRSRQNVLDSDGTLVITFGRAVGGTALTLRHARRCGKPLLVIQARPPDLEESLRQASRFVRRNSISVLNVAGPRASEAPRAHAFARTLIRRLLRSQ